jgi:deoxyribonuclease-4
MIMLRIGCHLPSSKGYLEMGKHAVSLGATTFAFFTRNPRGGKAKPIQEDDVKAFLAYAKEHDIDRLVAHAPYTMNLCSADPHIRQFGTDMLADDLQRMEFTPHQYYNFHPGSHVKQGAEVGISQIADALNQVLFPEQTTTVLLETMAGKGSEVGRNFEELHAILERVNLQEKMGVCLDTCHIWDGGYDIVGNLEQVLETFDRVIGLERLYAVHLNDSMNPLGAHKDRHQKIGQGEIGLEALARVTQHPALRHLPFILETPNDDAGYAAEITLLRSLSTEK